MVVINRIALIILLISSNIFLLHGQDKPQNPVGQSGQIKITPLHVPELENFKQVPTNPENTIQTSSTQGTPAQKPKPRPLILPAEWILESSAERISCLRSVPLSSSRSEGCPWLLFFNFLFLRFHNLRP